MIYFFPIFPPIFKSLHKMITQRLHGEIYFPYILYYEKKQNRKKNNYLIFNGFDFF